MESSSCISKTLTLTSARAPEYCESRLDCVKLPRQKTKEVSMRPCLFLPALDLSGAFAASIVQT